jgi:hypothetical protein
MVERCTKSKWLFLPDSDAYNTNSIQCGWRRLPHHRFRPSVSTQYCSYDTELMLRSGVGLTIPYKCVDAADTVESGDSKSADTTPEDTKSDNTKETRAVAEIEDQAGTYQDYTAYGKHCDKTEADGKLVGTAYVARDVKAIAESLGEDGLIRYMGMRLTIRGYRVLALTYSRLLVRHVARRYNLCHVSEQRRSHRAGRQCKCAGILFWPVCCCVSAVMSNANTVSGTESSADLDKAVRRFFDLCAQAGSDNCAWAIHGKDEKTLTDTYDKFLAGLSKSQSSTVRTMFFNVLYTTDFKDFAVKLQSWFEKPASIPADAQVTGNSKRDSDTFDATSGLAIKTPTAINAISCGDRIPGPDGTPDLFKKWLEDYQTVTKYGWDITSAGTLRCSVWPTRANEIYKNGFTNVIETKNPILFLNTQYDPVTPMISAETTAKAFKDAKVIRSSGLGVSMNSMGVISLLIHH